MDINKLQLKELCHINTNVGEDTFVGVRLIDGMVQVSFPIGFRLEETDKGIREDILLLLRILQQFSAVDRNKDQVDRTKEHIESFPYLAYQKVIFNYLDFGYYHEKEIDYKVSKRGKINWNRTIKTQSPWMVGNQIGYFDFVVKNVSYGKDTMITLINEYCVYESIYRLGWLYNICMPSKPRLKFKKDLFLSLLNEKLKCVFDDRTKELIICMIEIVSSLSPDGETNHKFGYGTNRFEYVWERMIDYCYGITDKADYFPKTSWLLNNGNSKINSPLEPDSIMIYKDNIYILDAKYYKYGVTGFPVNLPETSSISKQITYGEYVELNKKSNRQIYNAFIMPYNKMSDIFIGGPKVHAIGIASADWKADSKSYERVVGILLDVKDFMRNCNRLSSKDIDEMAIKIEEQLQFK
jgi:hypothetical protein